MVRGLFLKIQKKFLVSLLFVGFFCFAQRKSSDCVIPLVAANSENLFDWVFDGKVSDWSYRDSLVTAKVGESASWNRELFERKFKNYKLFLAQVGLPPLFATVELENENVGLRVAIAGGYDSLFGTRGSDPRGINNFLFAKDRDDVEIISVDRHRVEGRNFSGHPTRQILEVQLKIAGKYDLYLFINHWPSQMGPTVARFDAAERLRELVHRKTERNPEVRVIAMGDFNTVDDEKEPGLHPFTKSILDRSLTGHLFDVQDFIVEKNSRRRFPAGTYYFVPKKNGAEPQWNRFDRFLVSENLLGKTGLRVDLSSYEILMPKVSSEEITTPDGKRKIIIPKGFDPKTGLGVTDHFPIRMNLLY